MPYSDVDVGYVAHDVVLIIEHGQRGDALALHSLQCLREWSVAAVRLLLSGTV